MKNTGKMEQTKEKSVEAMTISQVRYMWDLLGVNNVDKAMEDYASQFQSRIQDLESKLSDQSKLIAELEGVMAVINEIKGINPEFKHYGLSVQTILKKYTDEGSI